MNNKEKAKEVANHRESEFGEIGDINYCCYMSALDMAQWKDEQFKQIVKDYIDLAYDSGQEANLLEDILKEL